MKETYTNKEIFMIPTVKPDHKTLPYFYLRRYKPGNSNGLSEMVSLKNFVSKLRT